MALQGQPHQLPQGFQVPPGEWPLGCQQLQGRASSRISSAGTGTHSGNLTLLLAGATCLVQVLVKEALTGVNIVRHNHKWWLVGSAATGNGHGAFCDRRMGPPVLAVRLLPCCLLGILAASGCPFLVMPTNLVTSHAQHA